MRAIFAGLSEIGPATVPYLPAAAAGAGARALGVGASRVPAIVRGAAATEGALVGLGETAGMGPEATALGIGVGLAGGTLAGSLGGKTYLDFAERDVGATRQWFQRWFTGDRGLPKGVMQLERQKAGQFQDVMNQVEARIRDMKKSMKDLEKSGGMSYKESEVALHEALGRKGGVDRLPPELQESARAMRNDIDRWSTMVRDSDMIPEDVKKIILENMGGYHHFSHEAFDNPLFAQLARSPENAETWQQALDLLQREIPGASTPELEGLMMTMVDRNPELMKFMGRGGFRLPELRFIKKRKEIAEPIRDLMGFYENPFINYQKSVAFMSADLIAHRTLKEQRALLLQMPEVAEGVGRLGSNPPDDLHYYPLRGFPGRDPFTKAGPYAGRDVPIITVGDQVRVSSRHKPGLVTAINRQAPHHKQVTVRFGDETRTFPLAKVKDLQGRDMHFSGAGRLKQPVRTDEGIPQLYATKDFWEFCEKSNEISRMTVLPMLNLMTHAAKTALSPQTHFRNFLSGTSMVALQGHLPFNRELWEVGKAAFGQPFAINKSEFMDDARFLLRRGVLGSSVHEGDLKAYIDNAVMMMQRGKVGKVRQKLVRSLQKGGDFAGRVYVAEDNFWKTFLFRKEMNRYMKIGGLDQAAARDMAAEVVEETMQIYSRIPLAIKKIRDFPLVGPFVSFPSEIVRNLKNTGKRALIEMSSEHPGVRKIGQIRLAGMFATTTLLPLSATMAGRAWTGTSQEQEDALREFMAPWTENSQFMLTGASPGQWDYFDLSFMDPYNYAKKPVMAMVRNFSMPDVTGYEALWETGKEAAQPWLGAEIILGEALKLKRTLEHRSQDKPSQKLGAAAYRAYKAFAPGALTSGERVVRSLEIPGIKNYLPAQSKFGRKLKPQHEIMALVGPRFTAVYVKESFRFRARDFSRGKGEAHAIWGEEAKVTDRGPIKRLQAKERAQWVYQKAGERMLRKIAAAKALGVTDKQMIQMLIDLNISKKDARSLVLHGNVPRLRLRDPA
jgi:hypothetical protein